MKIASKPQDDPFDTTKESSGEASRFQDKDWEASHRGWVKRLNHRIEHRRHLRIPKTQTRASDVFPDQEHAGLNTG
jgi:hypothetical protein